MAGEWWEFCRPRALGHVRQQESEAPALVTPAADAATPAASQKPAGNTTKKKKQWRPLVIDLEGIQRRVLPFPVADSRYGQIAGTPGRAIFTELPSMGSWTGKMTEEEEAEKDRCGPGTSRTTKPKM